MLAGLDQHDGLAHPGRLYGRAGSARGAAVDDNIVFLFGSVNASANSTPAGRNPAAKIFCTVAAASLMLANEADNVARAGLIAPAVAVLKHSVSGDSTDTFGYKKSPPQYPAGHS